MCHACGVKRQVQDRLLDADAWLFWYGELGTEWRLSGMLYSAPETFGMLVCALE
jgi:hypothetical protein